MKFALTAAAACLALAGCSSTGDQSKYSASLGAPASPSAVLGASAGTAEYRITREDTLDIAVYQVPDLSRSVQVDGAGVIVLPLLGAMPAAGRTVRELEGDIKRRLGARYLQSPQVSVSLREAVGQRVTIDGAVKNPGVILARGETTLLRALAEAKGFTETADLSGVIVFRVTAEGRASARFDADAIRLGKAADPPIYGGDTIVVDESGAKTTWKQFREALPVAGFFRVL